MLSRADIRNGGLDRWRRKSPATILFAILLTLGQMQSALAAITNSAIANGTYAAAPIVSLNSDVSVPVTPAASALTMTKTAVSASYDQIGDVISYTLEVANSGTGTVTAITVSDPGAGSVVCPVSGNATIASLAPGASETCTATHAVIAADMTAGTYVNTASATGTGPGGSAPAGNDTATVNRIDADLQTVKTLASGNSGPQVGDVVAYNVTVTNAGPADATNVSLTDLLPAGLTATAGNGVVTGGTYVPATGLWTIGLLASGASVTLALEGTVNNAANGTVITNIATAAVADQVDPSTATDDLTETVTVGQLSIAAADDDLTASPVPSTGGATPTVYVNDTLNGAPFAPAAVTPSIVADGGLTGVSINADGTLSVPAGMAAGSYPVTYSICEVLNPANCDEAVATVVVGTGTITALDDDFTASPVPSTGGATPTVYVNDTLNGAPFAAAAVTPSIVADGGLTGVSINADGTLSVPAGMAAGSYPVTYSICEVLNPANCDEAVATVVVGTGTITALDDDFTASPVPSTGGATPTVYVNDTLNGAPFAAAAVTPSIVADGGLTGVSINADGTLSVPAGMAAGSYPVTYSICEVLNPANCDEAVATVVVGTGTITALDDDFTASPVPSTGGATPTVYVNDTLNGAPFAAAAVTPSIVADGGLTGVSINADGTLSVPAGMAAGSYPVTYSICEVLNPANCDEAVATVVVESPATATLAGFVFEDANGNGAFDPGSDPVFGGYGVSVLDPSGAVVGTAITNPDGSYSVANLVPGVEYRIVFANPGGTVVGGISQHRAGCGREPAGSESAADPSGVIYDARDAAADSWRDSGHGRCWRYALPALSVVNPAQQSQVTGVDGGYRFRPDPGADPACPVGETAYQLLVTSPAGYQNGPSHPVAADGRSGRCHRVHLRCSAWRRLPDVGFGQSACSPAPAVYVLSVLLEAGDPDLIHNHIPLDPIAAPGGQVT